jgi:hypothetical protein
MVIKGILNFLDYSFYWITKTFSKNDTYDSSIGIVTLAISESLYIVNLTGIIVISTTTKAEFEPYSQIAIYLTGIIFALLVFLNYKRYTGKYIELVGKWKNEKFIMRIIKGIFVSVFILFPIVFPAIILNLKDYTQ